MQDFVDVNLLDEFDNDVKEYIRLNQQSGQSLTPKIHHLTHYSQLMKIFGPLKNYSCLRFERVNQRAKRSVMSSRNKKNLPFQIAKAYLKSPTFFFENRGNVEVTIEKENINDEISSIYSQFIDKSKELILVERFEMNRRTIKTDKVYLMKEADDSSFNYPIFFYVEHIVKSDNNYKILGNFIQSISFDKKKYSYSIRFSENDAELTDFNFKHYKHLDLVYIDESIYIPKTFHVNGQINYEI